MKAIVARAFGGPEVQKWVDAPDPKAGPNEVVIKVHAAALNYNDIHGRRGFPMQVPLPHISGSDVSGVIVDMGSEVRDFKTGDEVVVHCGTSCRTCAACTRGEEIFCRQFKIWGFQTGPYDGAYGEYIKIPAVQAIPKPKNIDHVQASSLGLILVTVWRQLYKRGGVKPGARIGMTDDVGLMAIDQPHTFKDFHATILAAMGVNPSRELMDGSRPVPATDQGTPIAALLG